MGAVLTPALEGVEKARDLPHACTLNGRCQKVISPALAVGRLAQGVNCELQSVDFGANARIRFPMEMQVSAISQDAVKVVLAGRLDAVGSARIDLPFSAVTGSNRHVLIDMSGVTFVASIGIRTLVLGAKTVQRRGGKLLLLSPQADIENVLETIGVIDLLPVVHDEAEATTAFAG
jgi:anti-sigma B factor antagonist